MRLLLILISNFNRCCQITFQNGHNNSDFHIQAQSRCSQSFNFCIPGRHKVMAHCYSNLHFPDYFRIYAYLMFVDHLNVLSYRLSSQFLCLFFYQLFLWFLSICMNPLHIIDLSLSAALQIFPQICVCIDLILGISCHLYILNCSAMFFL